MFESISKQNGILRVNCADSLDRTNIATFFLSFQLIGEMCRRLNATGLQLSNNSQRTWGLFDYPIDRVLQALKNTNLVETLAEFFGV